MKKTSKIKILLSNHKSISMSRFINLCLYESGNGYYTKKKVGEDFVTSPQLSQMFGECISVFFSLIQKKTFQTTNFLELGPGNGLLLRDLIRSIYKIKKEKINYFFLEKSNFLKVNSLKDLSDKANITKLEKFILEKKPYYFICYEFFDALPINQFERKKNIFYEKRIILKNSKFEIISKKSNFFSKRKINIKEGDVLEISPLSNLYLNKIFKHLNIYGGGIIIFDNGPSVKKKIDTIQAIRNKKKNNFLEHPYESDITYHIDFQEIKEKSLKFGLKAYGPISQKKFLYYNGINERFISLTKNLQSDKQLKALESNFRRLTDPEGMGGLIKCIYISKKELDLSYFK